MNLKKWIARATGALALSLVGGCATAETVTPVALAPEPIPGPALWQLSDADTTIYLFGTVHALPKDTDWFDQRIETAFAASGELVTEINMENQANAAQILTDSAMLQGGQTLRSLMTDEDRAEFEAALGGLGIPPAALDPVEPWFAALNLSMLPLLQSGYDPASGVDMVLTQAGAGKAKSALETIEEQVALFDQLPMAAQLELLDGTVESVPNAAATLKQMIALWIAGDADGLAGKMNEEMDDPALYQRLLIDRNAKWVEWIEQRLEQPGTVFIAVGAGHLAGTGSVQDQLGQRGHTVERVWQ